MGAAAISCGMIRVFNDQLWEAAVHNRPSDGRLTLGVRRLKASLLCASAEGYLQEGVIFEAWLQASQVNREAKLAMGPSTVDLTVDLALLEKKQST